MVSVLVCGSCQDSRKSCIKWNSRTRICIQNNAKNRSVWWSKARICPLKKTCAIVRATSPPICVHPGIICQSNLHANCKLKSHWHTVVVPRLVGETCLTPSCAHIGSNLTFAGIFLFLLPLLQTRAFKQVKTSPLPECGRLGVVGLVWSLPRRLIDRKLMEMIKRGGNWFTVP